MPLYVQILLSLAPYAVPPLATALVLFARSQIEKLPAQKRAFVENVVHTQVAAIAQTATSDLNGPAKKQLALEAIQKELAHFNVGVPDVVINGILEETVLALNAAKGAATIATTSVPVSPAPGSAHA